MKVMVELGTELRVLLSLFWGSLDAFGKGGSVTWLEKG